MALLSGLFGNSDNDSSNDLLGVIDAVASVDASFESYNQEVDSDGSSETSYDAGSFGTDLDVGSILSNMSDTMSDTDGLFG